MGHRRRGVGRVDRREDEVARFGRGQRDAHGLRIAHLADDEHVGRLPQRRAQGGGEVGSVDADLDLLDQARAVRVLVLDRVLDRDDVACVAPVDLLDERGERGRLARSGRASHEDEPARQPGEALGARRQSERGEAGRLRGERADRRGGAAALAVQIDPEAPDPRDPVRGVRDPGLAVLRARVARESRQHGLLDLLTGERRLLERDDAAVRPDRRRRTGHEQEVAALARDELLQPAVQANRSQSVDDFRGRSRLGRRGLRRTARRGRRAALVELSDQRVEVFLGLGHRSSAAAQPARCQSVCGALFSKIHARKSRP